MADASKVPQRQWVMRPEVSASEPAVLRRDSAVSRTLTFIETNVSARAASPVPKPIEHDAVTVPVRPTPRTQILGSACDPIAAAAPPAELAAEPPSQPADGELRSPPPVLIGTPPPTVRAGRELMRIHVEPALRSWRLLHPGDDALDASVDASIADAKRAPRADVEAVQLDARGRVDPSLVVVTRPASAHAARFRVMRHRLADHGAPRVVLVTSAEDGEGKSVAAANLALALAEGGRARVLLVDAHLRRPSQAALFGVEPPEGFFAQLARNGTRGEGPWTVGELDVGGLHLLAAGAPGEEASFDGRAFRAAIASLRERYDHVILDAPSVLTSADVSVIEDAADGVVFVARGRRARARSLRRALEQIAPSRLLGTMLLER